MAASQDQEKDMFALVRFPNWQNTTGVISTKDIKCSLVNSKEVPWKPKHCKDFNPQTPYKCVTAYESAVPGQSHPYCIQIYRISVSKEELNLDLNASKNPQDKSHRIKWCTIPDFPKDPDSSCPEDNSRGSNAHHPAVSVKQINLKRKVDNEQNQIEAFLKNHVVDQQEPVSDPSNVQRTPDACAEPEVDIPEIYKRRIQELEEQLKLEREKNDSKTESKLVKVFEQHMTRMMEEQKQALHLERQQITAQIKEDISKEVEQLQLQRLALQDEYRSDFYLLACSASASTSQGSTESGQNVYKEISKGFSIKSQYEQQLAFATSTEDFEELLLKASFDDYGHLRSKRSKTCQKFDDDWLVGAKAYYLNFLERRKDLGVSPLEAGIKVTSLSTRLSAIIQRRQLRGVNKVRAEARKENRDVELAVAEWRQSRPAGRQGKGGRPRKHPQTRVEESAGAQLQQQLPWTVVAARPGTSSARVDMEVDVSGAWPENILTNATNVLLNND